MCLLTEAKITMCGEMNFIPRVSLVGSLRDTRQCYPGRPDSEAHLPTKNIAVLHGVNVFLGSLTCALRATQHTELIGEPLHLYDIFQIAQCNGR